MAFIDLDRFKAINDHYGHDIGDRFLEAIGGRLQGVLRDSDMAARLGGDEFVVIATTQRGAADASAESLRARLFQATSGRFKLDHVVLDYGGPSIGMVVSKISDRDAQSLLAQADEQMYAVKRERHEGGSSRASEAVTH